MRLADIYAPIYTPWRKAHGGEGNRRIGEFLKELDLTEGRSPGIPKILKVMKENGSPPPEFETDEDRTSFLIRLPMHGRAAQGLAGELTPQVTEEAGTKLGLSRDQVLKPLLDAGLAKVTIPDKPRSSKQRYRLTDRGRQVLEELGVAGDHELKG